MPLALSKTNIAIEKSSYLTLSRILLDLYAKTNNLFQENIFWSKVFDLDQSPHIKEDIGPSTKMTPVSASPHMMSGPLGAFSKLTAGESAR